MQRMAAAIRIGSSVKLMQRCLIFFFHMYFRFLHLLFHRIQLLMCC